MVGRPFTMTGMDTVNISAGRAEQDSLLRASADDLRRQLEKARDALKEVDAFLMWMECGKDEVALEQIAHLRGVIKEAL